MDKKERYKFWKAYMSGAEMIKAERQRHADEEGWTLEHDDQWIHGELVRAAVTYLVWYLGNIIKQWTVNVVCFGELWPWDLKWWKTSNDEPIENLVKAGSMIAAEIDRMIRLEKVNENDTKNLL